MGGPGQRAVLLSLLRRLLLPLLVLQLQSEAKNTAFQLTETGQAFTGTALRTAAGGGAIHCALRCAGVEGCVALQVSAASCLLLSDAPSADQLTPTAGTRIFVDRLSLPVASADGRVPQECPSTWTRLGNACYITSKAANSRALWQEDGDYCSGTYGPAATLPTFENDVQFAYLAEHASPRVWVNIRYVDGCFKIPGSSSCWTANWASGEPDEYDDGFAYYDSRANALKGVLRTVTAMPRDNVVCMLYAGEE